MVLGEGESKFNAKRVKLPTALFQVNFTRYKTPKNHRTQRLNRLN